MINEGQIRRPRGRPPGKGRSAFPHIRSLRFGDRDALRLRRLAERLELTEAGVVRAGIRELARREGLE
jgi:hypothetical protein